MYIYIYLYVNVFMTCMTDCMKYGRIWMDDGFTNKQCDGMVMVTRDNFRLVAFPSRWHNENQSLIQ